MWTELFNLTLTTDWQLSEFTSSTVFRIKHTLNNYPDGSGVGAIAIVALANDSVEPIEILEPQKIIPRREAEIIKFSQVYGWMYKLAVKQIKLPSKPLLDWTMDVKASHVDPRDFIIKGHQEDLKLQPQFNSPKKLLFALI